jgi:hypothetical protein
VFRLLKWLVMLAAIAAMLGAASYAGARFTTGRLVGPTPPLSGREIRFEFKGVEELPGRPRAWVFTYGASRLPGVRSARIYVSPTGRLIATRPADLDLRLEAWEKAQQPE